MPDPRQDRGRPPLPGRRPDDHRRSAATIPPSVTLNAEERERLQRLADDFEEQARIEALGPYVDTIAAQVWERLERRLDAREAEAAGVSVHEYRLRRRGWRSW